MSALLDSLAAAFQGNSQQRALLDATLDEGLPHPRNEAWKYTSLRTLERRAFTAPNPGIAKIAPDILQTIPAPRLVFINGYFSATYSDLTGLPDGVQLTAATPGLDIIPAGTDAVFSRLNAALAITGAHLTVAANTITPIPLHLVTIGTETGHDHAWHLRHRLGIASGAKIQLIEHHLSQGAHRHLDNSVLELNLAESAHLTHVRIQHHSAGANCFLHTDAKLQARAEYTRLDLELGGALSRHELNIQLLGEAACVTANGILPANGRRHLDSRLNIEHHAKGTRCTLNWRGMGAERGRVVFHGGITIHPGADGSKAQLSSKNLLLSEQAEIDTQPVLIIHADDVEAAHGATVGQLDTHALFYLRARGIPLSDAKRLLTSAFMREPLLPLTYSPLPAITQQWFEHVLKEYPLNM